MPTTYTARIHEGENVTFAEFVMTCARAMGPLITMKEEPADAPVPDEFPPSPRYAQNAERHRRQLAAIEAWTPEQAGADAAAAHAGALREAERDNAVACVRRERFTAMLASVRAWVPPSLDHEPLKRFMAEQLTTAIDRECSERSLPEPVSGQEWRTTRAEQERRMAEYYEREAAREAEQARWRTGWIKALRASLGAPPPSAGGGDR
jgi:hypothetical protein